MLVRKRRVNVVLEGDNAALWDVCLTKLGLTDKSREKGTSDVTLLELAIHALDKHISEVSVETGVRFPSISVVATKAGMVAKTTAIDEE